MTWKLNLRALLDIRTVEYWNLQIDFRLMWYTALRARDVPVRFVKFPRQRHGIREPRLRRICDIEEIRWLEKYVRGVEWEPPNRTESSSP